MGDLFDGGVSFGCGVIFDGGVSFDDEVSFDIGLLGISIYREKCKKWPIWNGETRIVQAKVD